MKPINHIVTSVGLGAVLAVWLNSWMSGVVCFLSGILLDIDHHLDYFLARGEVPLSYRKLVDYCQHDKLSKMYLFFHSFELHLLIWVLIAVFRLNELWIGFAVGATFHLICDEFSNPFRPFGYFLTFRVSNRFERRKIFTEKHFNEAM